MELSICAQLTCSTFYLLYMEAVNIQLPVIYEKLSYDFPQDGFP